MAFLVQNTHRTFSTIFRKSFANTITQELSCSPNQSKIQLQALRACSNFPNANRMPTDEVDWDAQPNVEIIRNPPEWKYVEQVLPKHTVPKPAPKAEYPSGWQPQKPEALKQPYFIERNLSYMIPVYLKVDYRGTRKQTFIKCIKGDIWKLHSEVMDYIEYYMKKKERSKVNEFTQQIIINGDYVNLIKDFLGKKGF